MSTIFFWKGPGGTTDNPTSGNADDQNNWDGGAIPGDDDVVNLAGSGSYTVTFEGFGLYDFLSLYNAKGSTLVDSEQSILGLNSTVDNLGVIDIYNEFAIAVSDIKSRGNVVDYSGNDGIINDYKQFVIGGNLWNNGTISIVTDEYLSIGNSYLYFYYTNIDANEGHQGNIVLAGGVIEADNIDVGYANNAPNMLTVNSNTISGYGHLHNVYDIESLAVIDANSSAGTLVVADDAIVYNSGLMEASDDTGTGLSGSLVINGAVKGNNEIEAIESGEVTIAGSVTGGTIHSSNGGSVVISGQVTAVALDLSSSEASLVISGIMQGGSLQTENGAAIALAGGTLDGTGGQVYNAGALYVGADDYATIKGKIDNAGTITLGGAGLVAGLLVGSATTTLTGGGSIILDDGGANVIDATRSGYVLIDVDDTITGNGALGTGNLVLDNETTIDATGGSPLFVELSTAAASINTGTLEATNGGELQFVRGLLTNNGGIAAGLNSAVQFAKAMQLSNFSAGALTGGTWSVGAGGTMIFGEGAITTDSATISLTGVGSVIESGSGYNFAPLEQTLTTIAAGGVLELTSRAYTTKNAISLDGTLSLGLNASVFTSDLITASATSTIFSFFGTVASSLTDAGAVNARSNGTLTFTGASELFTGALSAPNGTIAFTNGAHASLNAGATVGVKTLSLSGVGTTLNVNENVTDDGALNEAVSAIVNIASGDTLTLGGVSTLSGAIAGAGGLGLAGGTLTLNGKNTFTGAIAFDVRTVSKLVLSAHALPANAIVGLAVGDTIDLKGLAYVAKDHIVFTLNAAHTGGTLSIENAAGTVLESLRIAGDYAAAHFTLASDSAGGMLITTVGAGVQAPDDFNGDGASDLLWANSTSGQIEDWLIVKGALSKSHVLATLSAASGQSVVGEGDFNGDGTTDLLIQNSKTGVMTEWDLANGVRGASVPITTPLSFAGWQVAGVGDFNGDGVSDILLQDKTTGSVTDLLMHGGKVVSSNLLGSPGADWTVVATGDFNGDGAVDLLWRNSVSGQLEDWALTNGKYQGDEYIDQVASGWSFAGTGDFLGDGTTEILLQSTTGALAISQLALGGLWLTVDSSVTLPTGFGVIAVSDFNGDGVSDVAIQNKSTGQAELGLVSGGDIAQWTSVGTLSASGGWHLLA